MPGSVLPFSMPDDVTAPGSISIGETRVGMRQSVRSKRSMQAAVSQQTEVAVFDVFAVFDEFDVWRI